MAAFRRKGSISVFLSLLLVFLLVFSLVLLESARINSIRYADASAGNAAVKSIEASFIRQLFDEYGILLYDGGQGSGWINEEAIEAQIRDYYTLNRSPQAIFGGSFFRGSPFRIQLLEMISATDYRGTGFIRNAAAYYPYEAAGEVLAMIREELGLFGKGDAAKSDADGKDAEREDTDWSDFFEVPGDGHNGKVPGRKTLKQMSEAESGGKTDDSADGNDFDEERYEDAIEESVIGDADEVRAKGWLSLVIPAGTAISGRTLDTDDLPSLCARDERMPDEPAGWMDKIAFQEYLLSTFSNYLEKKRDDTVQYEVEYMLAGKDSDEANLKAVLERIIWMREGMNILYLYGSPVRREEAMAMAAALTGWAGIPLLTILTQASLIAAWAYAESILDVRTLVKGKKVPIMKTDESWTLTLAQTPGFLKGNAMEAKSSEVGMDYQGFLRLLLYLKDSEDLAYRAMDMIQTYLRRYDGSFCMANALCSMRVRITSETAPLFSALPLVRQWISGKEGNYFLSSDYVISYQ